MSRTSAGTVGAPSSYTEFGPPLRMMPVGFHSRTHSADRVGGWISEYTPASRTLRAMSCVNCDPKSRIRMRLVIPGLPRPLGFLELKKFHGERLEVENRGRGHAEHPAARLPRI